jgi:hypothetical protein
LQKLAFFISLLDDRARFNPYECALVMAIAVFGATEQGWRSPDAYTPILSGIIKLARLMVVQQVMTEAGYEGNESDSLVRSLGDDKPGLHQDKRLSLQDGSWISSYNSTNHFKYCCCGN